MTNFTQLSFEATTDLVQRMYDHATPVRRVGVGAMEIVSGKVGAAEHVSLIIDGATGQSVRLP